MTEMPEKIRCDACPVMCYIAEGRAGACDRYANQDGRIIRSQAARTAFVHAHPCPANGVTPRPRTLVACA